LTSLVECKPCKPHWFPRCLSVCRQRTCASALTPLGAAVDTAAQHPGRGWGVRGGTLRPEMNGHRCRPGAAAWTPRRRSHGPLDIFCWFFLPGGSCAGDATAACVLRADYWTCGVRLYLEMKSTIPPCNNKVITDKPSAVRIRMTIFGLCE